MAIVSAPKYDLIRRFRLDEVGLTFRCNSCNKPVSLIYGIVSRNANPIQLSNSYTRTQIALEPYESKYLEGPVADDFREALICYANSCWNAFAAMCRRCIQSVSAALGVEGTTKVQQQLNELQGLGVADDQTFEQLKQIMLTGHDGAHPHLPALSQERAEVLLQLMKDVLYQLFVRPAKIKEAVELRSKAKKS
jgi:hypothetical protein